MHLPARFVSQRIGLVFSLIEATQEGTDYKMKSAKVKMKKMVTTRIAGCVL